MMGNVLMTGAVFGTDPSTGQLAERVEDQVTLMFRNVERILSAAGGSWDDVLKMTFYARPELSREHINRHWVIAFPDPASRPARHVMVSDRLPARMHVQCDLIAFVGSGARGNASVS